MTPSRSAITKYEIFTSLLQNLTKTWAFSPKTVLGGSHSQHLMSTMNPIEVTISPFVNEKSTKKTFAEQGIMNKIHTSYIV